MDEDEQGGGIRADAHEGERVQSERYRYVSKISVPALARVLLI